MPYTLPNLPASMPVVAFGLMTFLPKLLLILGALVGGLIARKQLIQFFGQKTIDKIDAKVAENTAQENGVEGDNAALNQQAIDLQSRIDQIDQSVPPNPTEAQVLDFFKKAQEKLDDKK